MASRKFQQFLYGSYLYPFLWATKNFKIGHNVLDSDWDALIILDACRVDALQNVASEYDFIGDVESRWSVGSTSKEWLINTFRREYTQDVNEIGLVTGNAWAEVLFEEEPNWGSWTSLKGSIWDGHPISTIAERELIREDDFHTYLPVWVNEGRRNGNTAPRAEHVTDAAINVGREANPERLVVHYMQPHEPFFHDSGDDTHLSEINKNPTEALRNGEKKSKIWEGYLDNLRYVLDSVELLLENMEAEKVVITADHGELFGEVGLVGHFAGFPHPKLRKVPWVETEAVDKETYTPEKNFSDMKNSSGDVEDRLADLGYL
ncbi:PglZ domain-containing protein [Haloarcula salina]|uniref:PglZ domain-containing protein n=1 Tax=Haloarcula salina TaxID=1429914 RepID=UPI003C6F6D36